MINQHNYDKVYEFFHHIINYGRDYADKRNNRLNKFNNKYDLIPFMYNTHNLLQQDLPITWMMEMENFDDHKISPLFIEVLANNNNNLSVNFETEKIPPLNNPLLRDNDVEIETKKDLTQHLRFAQRKLDKNKLSHIRENNPLIFNKLINSTTYSIIEQEPVTIDDYTQATCAEFLNENQINDVITFINEARSDLFLNEELYDELKTKINRGLIINSNKPIITNDAEYNFMIRFHYYHGYAQDLHTIIKFDEDKVTILEMK